MLHRQKKPQNLGRMGCMSEVTKRLELFFKNHNENWFFAVYILLIYHQIPLKNFLVLIHIWDCCDNALFSFVTSSLYNFRTNDTNGYKLQSISILPQWWHTLTWVSGQIKGGEQFFARVYEEGGSFILLPQKVRQ